MNFEAIDLAGGCVVHIEQAALRIAYKDDGLHGLDVGYADGTHQVLPEAVDDGQTVACPRIHVIFNRGVAACFVFGGVQTYRVDVEQRTADPVTTYRKRECDEYWETEIVILGDYALIIYESGIIKVDNALRIDWQARKFLTEAYKTCTRDWLVLVGDDDKEIRLGMQNGSRV